jgi:aminoglycoside phosphotransferase (APT) family kinase protein
LWIELETTPIGGPFFASRRVLGQTIGDVWGAPDASPDLCLDIAEVYARVHAIDVHGIEAPVSPRTNRDELSAMIDWAQRTIEIRNATEDPLLQALIAWLRAHIPPAPARPSLVHGDAAFSNLLVTGDRVAAVLDWEQAHLGDPAEELAYLRPSIEPVLPWPDFVERYVQAGGRSPDPSRLQFYEVWSHTWRHIGCLGLAAQFENSGRYSSAVAAYVLGPRFLDNAARLAFGPVTQPVTLTMNDTGGSHADA